MQSGSESPTAIWSTPECPFRIEYSRQVLDDIRLAVVDAFFSLPRGGVEIGGLLLGKYQGGAVVISESIALDCEHAFGPSFALSQKDQAELQQLIAAAASRPGAKPVGWWHSHTRSEVTLSDADCEIHNRYFREPWHVALVLKPHTFLPARAGFFFREPDGDIHASSSYREFPLDPLPARQLPPSVVPPVAARSPEDRPLGPTITVTAQVQSEEPSAMPEPVRAELAAPEPRASVQKANRSRSWMGFLLVVLGVAIGVAGSEARRLWMPSGAVGPAASDANARLGLNTVEEQGNFQVRWDRDEPGLRGAHGILIVTDGAAEPKAVELDSAHLQAGLFTYARQAERVDVSLTVYRQDGRQVREVTSFMGKPVAKTVESGPPGEAAGLKADLAREVARSRKLEKELQDARQQIRKAQRGRLANQSRDRTR